MWGLVKWKIGNTPSHEFFLTYYLYVNLSRHTVVMKSDAGEGTKGPDHTFHASSHSVENCSLRYCLLNNERDGAIFIIKEKEFCITIPW